MHFFGVKIRVPVDVVSNTIKTEVESTYFSVNGVALRDEEIDDLTRLK